MNNETTNRPLYKVLNNCRTGGEWKHRSLNNGHEEIQTDTFNLAGSTIFEVNFENKEYEANAQYTVMAVNNLHLLAEALEWIENEIKTTPDELQDALQGVILIKIKEALQRIS